MEWHVYPGNNLALNVDALQRIGDLAGLHTLVVTPYQGDVDIVERRTRLSGIGSPSLKINADGSGSFGLARTEVESTTIARAEVKTVDIDASDPPMPIEYRWYAGKIGLNSPNLSRRAAKMAEKEHISLDDALAAQYDRALKLGILATAWRTSVVEPFKDGRNRFKIAMTALVAGAAALAFLPVSATAAGVAGLTSIVAANVGNYVGAKQDIKSWYGDEVDVEPRKSVLPHGLALGSLVRLAFRLARTKLIGVAPPEAIVQETESRQLVGQAA